MFLANTLFFLGVLGKSCQIVVTTKVEIHHFLDFSFYHFGNIEMV